MKYLKLFCLIFALCFVLSSCSADTFDPALVDEVMGAAERTNAIKKYSASFLLEVTDESTGNIIVFAQGSYDADKTSALKMSGSMVQTVNASPASLYMAYNGGRYYAKSGDVSTFSEIDEEVFLKQFLCSGVIITHDVGSITKTGNGSGGAVYAFEADSPELKGELLPLVDAEVFYYSGMKKLRADTLSVSGFRGEYVVDEKSGLLCSRTVEYTETAYDTAPYYPNSTAGEETLKHTLNVRIKQTYKTLDGTTEVVLPSFAQEG